MIDTSSTKNPAIGRLGSTGLLLLGLAALIASLSTAIHSNRAPPKPSPALNQHDFQLIQLSQFRQDQFLVDRKTGQVWQRICTGKVAGSDCSGLEIWDEMYVSSVTPTDSGATDAYLTQEARK